ncbi:MAG: hypothetical protein IKB67_03730 [Clostridia bacterium]|nr:hypothetical protein [Clostridia bacterium]
MTFTIIIASLTAATMISAVLIKPYATIKNFSIGLYWVVCLIGAIAMLAFNRLPLSSAINGITAQTSVNPIKILTLFLSMTLLSVYLGDAGFFDYITEKVFLKTKGSAFKLFILLYAVVSVLTIFTSNDIIILTFTPPICIFAKKAKISPIPFLLGEFVAANTWSMTLIIGNPTNIYLAGSAGINFINYLSVMWLPALFGGLTGLITIILLFRKQLFRPLPKTDSLHHGAPHMIIKHKTPLIVAIVHLLVCIMLLAISDLIGLEMWIICLTLALSMTVFDLVYDIIVEHSAIPVLRSLKKEPYELIPFVLSMFIIVLALKECGVTSALNKLLITNSKTDGVTFGVLSALSANLLNNIPMSVLFESIIGGDSVPALYGAIIGSNVGAFITPVGALAGIMWNKILSRYGVKLSFIKFVIYGVAIAVPTLFASIGALMLIL